MEERKQTFVSPKLPNYNERKQRYIG